MACGFLTPDFFAVEAIGTAILQTIAFALVGVALAAVFAALPADAIVGRLVAHGIPASRFRLLEEVLFDDEAEALSIHSLEQTHRLPVGIALA